MSLITKIFDHADRRAVLMGRMMQRLEVQDVGLAGISVGFQGIVNRCRWCVHTKECQRWLDGGAGDRHDFCPNASAFDALKAG